MDQNYEVIRSLLSQGALIDKNGRPYNPDLIKDCKVFVLYFSAHWCPPCRQFTPILAQQFSIYRQASSKATVIFVSGDRSFQEQLNYMREAHGDWPAVRCDSSLTSRLNSVFQVRGIPKVVVVKVSNGECISQDGRQDIMQNGALAFSSWEQSCIEIDTSIVKKLTDNDPKTFQDAKEILLKLINNILRDPNNVKFRRIRLSNPKVESMLLNANGAFDILFSIGFEEDTDALILPLASPLEVIKAFHTAIEQTQPAKIEGSNVNSQEIGANSSTSTTSKKPERDIICNGDICLDIGKERPLMNFTKYDFNPSAINPDLISLSSTSHFSGNSKEKWVEISSYIKSAISLAKQREDPRAHEAVFKEVPIQRIESQVKEKFKELFQQDPSTSVKIMRDLAVYELVSWFKKDFFKWVDALKCYDGVCNGVPMQATGHGNPTFDEVSGGASRVECYVCSRCQNTKRFPRYNSPIKLLQTRQGRCGEWANCFALILRAFGYLTRHVNDFKDHVWCEFFSETEQRWIHVDPCEGLVDKPKVYDHGWGKKYDLVMAASIFDVQDVTKRYVVDHEELKSRRSKMQELYQWINSNLPNVAEFLQSKLSGDMKIKFAEMGLKELADLMFAKSKNVSDEEAQGRQSGSLAWRLSRQETTKGFVIKPTNLEIEAKKIDISYDINGDKYVRWSNNKETVKNWSAFTFHNENIFKKEEQDWKMIYLARKEYDKPGKIVWKIDMNDSKLQVKSVELLVQSKSFENGKIIWQLAGDSKTLLPTPGITLKSEELSGSKSLTLQVSMSGGKGNLAWQHTQLFRTKMDDNETTQFRLIIQLKEVSS